MRFESFNPSELDQSTSMSKSGSRKSNQRDDERIAPPDSQILDESLPSRCFGAMFFCVCHNKIRRRRHFHHRKS
jgi:hypothetical protein